MRQLHSLIVSLLLCHRLTVESLELHGCGVDPRFTLSYLFNCISKHVEICRLFISTPPQGKILHNSPPLRQCFYSAFDGSLLIVDRTLILCYLQQPQFDYGTLQPFTCRCAPCRSFFCT